MIAALSGVLALVLAWWTQSLVTSFAIPIDEPQHIDLTPDRTVVLFIAGLVVAGWRLAGPVAGLRGRAGERGARARLAGRKRAGGRPSPLRRWLVGAQIAGSTVFVTVAALFLQSYGYLSDDDFGFAKEHLPSRSYGRPQADTRPIERAAMSMRSALACERFPASTIRGRRQRSVLHRLRSRTVVWPTAGTCDAAGCPAFPTYAVSRGYFRTMGIPLVEGREFDEVRGAAQVVINQSFARKQWPRVARSAPRSHRRRRHAGYGGRHSAKTHTRGLDREVPVLFVPSAPSISRAAWPSSCAPPPRPRRSFVRSSIWRTRSIRTCRWSRSRRWKSGWRSVMAVPHAEPHVLPVRRAGGDPGGRRVGRRRRSRREPADARIRRPRVDWRARRATFWWTC